MQHFSFPLQYIVSSFLFLVYIILFLVSSFKFFFALAAPKAQVSPEPQALYPCEALCPQLCCFTRPKGLTRATGSLPVRSTLLAALLLYTPKGPYPSRRLFTRAKHFARSSAALHATLSLYPQLCCLTRRSASHILFLTDHDAIFGNVQNISFGASRKKLTDCLATSEAVISVCATLT